jgi:hypothetical protein
MKYIVTVKDAKGIDWVFEDVIECMPVFTRMDRNKGKVLTEDEADEVIKLYSNRLEEVIEKIEVI